MAARPRVPAPRLPGCGCDLPSSPPAVRPLPTRPAAVPPLGTEGRGHLFGRLPEHIAHAAPAPQPMTQHGDDAHEQRLARVLLVLLRLLGEEQLCEHGERQTGVSEARLSALRWPLKATSPADRQERERRKGRTPHVTYVLSTR